MRTTYLLLVLTMVAAPAMAQDAGSVSTGSLGSQDLARNGESDVNNLPLNGAQATSSRQQIVAYEQAQDYSRCAARLAPRVAAGVLAADPNSADERNGMLQLYAAGRPCLAYGANPPTAFVRGGLAEALVARAPALPATVTPERGGAFQAAGKIRSARNRDFADFSNCAVVHAPDQIRVLLRTKAGSKAEKAAFDAMLVGAEGCAGKDKLPATGVTPGLRMYFAESAWRWSDFTKGG